MPVITRDRMDALVDDHYRAEETGDMPLSELRIDRFETVRRWYGDRQVVDESILHGTAVGSVFGLEGRGRHVQVRLLHVFDFADGLISRESAWLDLAGLQRQLGADGPDHRPQEDDA
jgi:predicted ester cyclase